MNIQHNINNNIMRIIFYVSINLKGKEGIDFKKIKLTPVAWTNIQGVAKFIFHLTPKDPATYSSLYNQLLFDFKTSNLTQTVITRSGHGFTIHRLPLLTSFDSIDPFLLSTIENLTI